MTIEDWLKRIAEAMKSLTPDNSQFEARALVQEALGLSSVDLVVRSQESLSADQEAKLIRWLDERSQGIPLAYLSGHKGFYKHDFVVPRGVLVPRPETELVVSVALERAADAQVAADLGCGTGCIGLSWLAEKPNAKLYSIDASPVAVSATKENAARLQLSARTTVFESSVESWRVPEPLDLVLANPPYIPQNDPRVETHVHSHEPHAALYSGESGLEALSSWTAFAANALKPGGLVVLEFGAGQTCELQKILEDAGFTEIQITKDLAGIDRVMSAKVQAKK